jgi:hypothetical protein
VTLHPVRRNVSVGIRFDWRRLFRRQTFRDALDRIAGEVAGFVDLQQVGPTDRVPDLLAVKITRYSGKRFERRSASRGRNGRHFCIELEISLRPYRQSVHLTLCQKFSTCH